MRQRSNTTHDIQLNLVVCLNINLIKLDPYLESDGLVRVGGRIRHDNVPRDQVIITKSVYLTQLLIQVQ